MRVLTESWLVLSRVAVASIALAISSYMFRSSHRMIPGFTLMKLKVEANVVMRCRRAEGLACDRKRATIDIVTSTCTCDSPTQVIRPCYP